MVNYSSGSRGAVCQLLGGWKEGVCQGTLHKLQGADVQVSIHILIHLVRLLPQGLLRSSWTYSPDQRAHNKQSGR